MYPLMLCLVGVFLLTFDRALALARSHGPATRLTGALASHLRQGDLAGALALCAATPGMASRIAQSILHEGLTTPERVHAAREAALLRELPVLEARVGWFGSLANLATLVGLLGSVTGLNTGFGCVGPADAASRATMLAKGIAESLTCTLAGLSIAVLALVGRMVIQRRLDARSAILRAEAAAVANLAVAYRARLRLGGARPRVEGTGYRRPT